MMTGSAPHFCEVGGAGEVSSVLGEAIVAQASFYAESESTSFWEPAGIGGQVWPKLQNSCKIKSHCPPCFQSKTHIHTSLCLRHMLHCGQVCVAKPLSGNTCHLLGGPQPGHLLRPGSWRLYLIVSLPNPAPQSL